MIKINKRQIKVTWSELLSPFLVIPIFFTVLIPFSQIVYKFYLGGCPPNSGFAAFACAFLVIEAVGISLFPSIPISFILYFLLRKKIRMLATFYFLVILVYLIYYLFFYLPS